MPWRLAYFLMRSRKNRLAVSSSKTWVELWLRQVQWLVEPGLTRRQRGMRATAGAQASDVPSATGRDFRGLAMLVEMKVVALGWGWREVERMLNVRHRGAEP